MELKTVFVVDDDQDVRDSLTMLLQVNNFKVITFPSAESFLMTNIKDMVACLVLDVRMQGIDGFELQKILVERKISLPIIFITGHGDVRMAVKAMKSGAVDFLEKPFSKEELLLKINNGLEISARNQKTALRQRDIDCLYKSLSPRERQVMQLMVRPEGSCATKRIAQILNISARTAEKHRAQVMKKMQVKSLPELVNISQHC